MKSRELAFALHRHDANEGETFAETRTGLDHVGLGVPAGQIWKLGRLTWMRKA